MTLFLSTVVAEHFTGEVTFNLQYAMNGCLSGLVAITAGCSVVESWAALVIGLVAGANYLAFSKLLVKRRIDDAVDAIPVHVSLDINSGAHTRLDCISPNLFISLTDDQWHLGVHRCRAIRRTKVHGSRVQ